MNKYENWLNVENNSVITQNQQPSPLVIISRIWRHWTNWLTNLGDVQVRQRVDRFGNSYWQAYNPITRRSLCSGSELEIRIWIEQQLYQ